MAISARLLAIVSTTPKSRVQCQNLGCGHGVYAAIHVVEDGGRLVVLGSTCFAKRYGGRLALGKPSYSPGGGGGTVLSEEERQMLRDNTAALMAMFKHQHEHAMRVAADKLKAMRVQFSQPTAYQLQVQASLAPRLSASTRRPWSWQHPKNTSIGVFSSPSGQNWIRVQHMDGTQKLAPWPMFDGWDEALPPSCGAPDFDLLAYSVSDLQKAFSTLIELGHTGPEVTIPQGLPR